jgi:hypothetical protein
MGKHTDGPWEAIDTGGFPYNIRSKDDVFVAACFTVRDETAANAKLIAAAPELLDALKEIVSNWDGEPEDMAAASAAIAKATR